MYIHKGKPVKPVSGAIGEIIAIDFVLLQSEQVGHDSWLMTSDQASSEMRHTVCVKEGFSYDTVIPERDVCWSSNRVNIQCRVLDLYSFDIFCPPHFFSYTYAYWRTTEFMIQTWTESFLNGCLRDWLKHCIMHTFTHTVWSDSY